MFSLCLLLNLNSIVQKALPKHNGESRKRKWSIEQENRRRRWMRLGSVAPWMAWQPTSTAYREGTNEDSNKLYVLVNLPTKGAVFFVRRERKPQE